MRPCPNCAEPLGNWMKVCDKCGCDLSSPAASRPPLPTAANRPATQSAAVRQRISVEEANERHFQLLVMRLLVFAVLLCIGAGVGTGIFFSPYAGVMVSGFMLMLVGLMVLWVRNPTF